MGATPFCLSRIAVPSGSCVEVAVASSSTWSFDGLDLMRLDGGFSRSSMEACLSSFSVFALVTSPLAETSRAMTASATTGEGAERSERVDMSVQDLRSAVAMAGSRGSFPGGVKALKSRGAMGSEFPSQSHAHQVSLAIAMRSDALRSGQIRANQAGLQVGLGRRSDRGERGVIRCSVGGWVALEMSPESGCGNMNYGVRSMYSGVAE